MRMEKELPGIWKLVDYIEAQSGKGKKTSERNGKAR
jgi:hypothetical protein